MLTITQNYIIQFEYFRCILYKHMASSNNCFYQIQSIGKSSSLSKVSPGFSLNQERNYHFIFCQRQTHMRNTFVPIKTICII